MKASSIRELSESELQSRISEVKKNLFNLKFQKASGQLDNPMKIKNLKKDIARIETVARELKLGIKISKINKKFEKAAEAKQTKKIKAAKEKSEKEKAEVRETAEVKEARQNIRRKKTK